MCEWASERVLNLNGSFHVCLLFICSFFFSSSSTYCYLNSIQNCELMWFFWSNVCINKEWAICGKCIRSIKKKADKVCLFLLLQFVFNRLFVNSNYHLCKYSHECIESKYSICSNFNLNTHFNANTFSYINKILNFHNNNKKKLFIYGYAIMETLSWSQIETLIDTLICSEYGE